MMMENHRALGQILGKERELDLSDAERAHIIVQMAWMQKMLEERGFELDNNVGRA